MLDLNQQQKLTRKNQKKREKKPDQTAETEDLIMKHQTLRKASHVSYLTSQQITQISTTNDITCNSLQG